MYFPCLVKLSLLNSDCKLGYASMQSFSLGHSAHRLEPISTHQPQDTIRHTAHSPPRSMYMSLRENRYRI